jgi:hypothetical protein
MNGNVRKIFLIIALVATVAAGCSIKKASNSSNNQSTQSSTIAYKGQQGRTALDLLKSNYKVDTQTFSSGEFVKTINGITPDKDHYWSLFINGKESTVGAGQYVTKDGDSVEWKLQQINTSL